MRPFIAGNWKMNHTSAEARAFAESLRSRLTAPVKADVWIFPPATLLGPLAAAFEGSPVRVGAQNLHWESSGAYTGELSVGHITDAGGQGVLVGHSERRHVFGETDDDANRKVLAALGSGLETVLCVGETLEEREADRTEAVVLGQLRTAMAGVSANASALTVAYEPVWAIGTGKTATPEQAAEVHAMIRAELAALLGPEQGASTPILYGGSVKPDNVAGLMAQPHVNGCLVGGASLKPDSFADILFGAL